VRKHSVTFIASLGLVMTTAAVIWLTSAAHAESKGSGKVKVQDISVTKYHDVSSQPIMRRSSPTKKAGHLTVRKAGGGQQE
jgi:type VI protein secretion system component Hcp